MKIKNMLIVEDDMIIQMFISRILTKMDFNVIGEVRKGQDAIDLVKESKPDLILMDIGLAGSLDGVETANLINEKFDIPVIFMTGNSDKATLAKAKESKPLDIIIKPIDEDRLMNQMMNLNRV